MRRACCAPRLPVDRFLACQPADSRGERSADAAPDALAGGPRAAPRRVQACRGGL